MRTKIAIDDRLMRETLRATGLKTKREAVEQGLRTFLRLSRQAFAGFGAEWTGRAISTR